MSTRGYFQAVVRVAGSLQQHSELFDTIYDLRKGIAKNKAYKLVGWQKVEVRVDIKKEWDEDGSESED